MKKILTGFVIVFVLLLQSCLKSDENVDFSHLVYVTEILWPPVASASAADATGSGLNYFGAGALTSLNPADAVDTLYFIVNLAGTNQTMSKDLPISVGMDASKLLDNFSNDSITYESMPDSVYKILNSSSVIPAGKRLDTVYVEFYSNKIDFSKNYGLPITITSAPGTTISSNFGTLYLHIIGNPIAGAYTRQWLRWNATDSTGSPTLTSTSTQVFAPSNATTIQVASGTGTLYILSFTKTNNVLSDFNVSFDPASVTAAGITITSGPTIERADPVAGVYRFTFSYLNGSGAPRVIVDEFTK